MGEARRKALAARHAARGRREFVLDELRQLGSGGGFGLGDESRGVLLRQVVQLGLLGR